MAITLISTVTVGAGGAATFSFTSIPTTFTDLLIEASIRTASGNGATNLTFNSDTGTNYSWRVLYGNGSTTSSTTGASQVKVAIGQGSYPSDTASTFGSASIYIPNYLSSSAKSLSVDSVEENNGAAAAQNIYAGIWTGTAAITSIQFVLNSATFDVGTSVSLYGISKSGATGATVA